MIDAMKLLAHLGCQSDQPITELQPCPLHPTTPPSLRIIDNPDGCLFYCINCGYEYDPIQLAAKALGCTEEQVIHKFSADQELADTLTGNTPECHITEYLNRRKSQACIHDYAANCHAALLESADGHFATSTLRGQGLLTRDVPDDMGLVLTTGVPDELSALQSAQCRRSPHILYTYHYGPYVTGVAIRDLKDPKQYKSIPLTRQERGIFLVKNISPTTESLIIAENEQYAASLTSQASGFSAVVPPIVSIMGLPLPFTYRNLKRCVILNPKDAPPSLERTLALFSDPNWIEGYNYTPELLAVDMPAQQISTGSLHRLLREAYPLEVLLARQLHALYKDSGMVGVRALTNTLTTRPPKALFGGLRTIGAPQELITMLRDPAHWEAERIILGNGRVVKRQNDGFRGIEPGSNEVRTLSTFTLQFLEVIKQRNKRMLYRCVLTNPGAPPCVVELPAGVFKSAAGLREAVSNIFIEKGYHLQVSAYAFTHFPWSEIRDAFVALDDAKIVEEVQQLGVCGKTIELPQLTLSKAATQLAPQTKTLKISQDVLDVYNGIRPFTHRRGGLAACRQLWSSDNTGDVAIALMCSYIVYCLLYGLACKRADLTAGKQHLALVDSPPDTWLPLFKQFVYLTSGIAHAPVTGKKTQSFKKMADLGDLPYPVNLTATDLCSVDELMGNSVVNTIHIATDAQAERLSKRTRTTFIDIDRADLAIPECVNPQLLSNIRHELPELFQTVIQSGWHLSLDQFKAITHPAHGAYMTIAQILGVTPAAECATAICNSEHVSYAINILPNFFKSMRKMFYGKEANCSVVDGLPTKEGKPGEHVYLTDAAAFIRYTVLDALQSTFKDVAVQRFTPARITRHLHHWGFLVPTIELPRGTRRLSGSTYWALARDEWDARVALGKYDAPLRILRKVG